MRRLLVPFAFAVALPALLHAQGRGGMAAAGMAHSFAAPAPHSAAHFSAPAAGRSTSGVRPAAAGQFVRSRSGALVYRRPPQAPASTFRSNSGRRLLSQDVPGLGFDYAHLAAVGGNRGRGRFRGRDFGRRSLFAYFPFYGGGGYFPLFDYDDSSGPSDQYAETVEPDYYPPYPAEPPPPRPADLEQGYGPPPAPAAEPTPARPADEYVFVRRDGTLFFAVAYTWENGTLRYITGEGVRLSVAGNAIDLGATQQFNEQRGLSFRFPA